jgi:hypothetical protein
MPCTLHTISNILTWNEIKHPNILVVIPFSHRLCNLAPLALKPEVIKWFFELSGDGGTCFFYTGIFTTSNYYYPGAIRDQLCFRFSLKSTAMIFKLTFA